MRQAVSICLSILLLIILTSCTKEEKVVREKDEAPPIDHFFGSVKSPNVHVLDQPHPKANPGEKFPWGTKFKLVDRSLYMFNQPVSGGIDFYYQIKFKDGTFAWVYGNDLLIEKTEIESSSLGKAHLTIFPTGHFEKPYRAWEYRCFGYEAPRVCGILFADVCDSRGAELIALASKMKVTEKEAPAIVEAPQKEPEKKKKPPQETTPKEMSEEEVSALMTPELDDFAEPEVVPLKEEAREVWVCVLNEDTEELLFELPTITIVRNPQRIDEVELCYTEVEEDYYAVLLLIFHHDIGEKKEITSTTIEGKLYLLEEGEFGEVWSGELPPADEYSFYRDEERNFQLE